MLLPDRAGRIAMISVHTSPLANPGGRDAGGMNVYVRELAGRLATLGRPVDVFTRRTSPDEPMSREIGDGARLISIAAGPPVPLPKDDLFDVLPEFSRHVRRYAEALDVTYSVVHSHYWLSGWAGRRLAGEWRVPHVTTFHTLGEVKNRVRFAERESERRIAIERLVARTADRVVCVSPEEKVLLSRYYGVDARRITVIPPGVDLERFAPSDRAACKSALGLGAPAVILYVGRIEPLKGIEILLRACGQLPSDLDYRLVIVGGDEHSEARVAGLRHEAQALGIGERVLFAGSVPHDRLSLYYGAADVCVVPSYFESFGMVALEAMACGRPVVASRVGGLGSTIRDGETGYLVAWRCPEPFAERIETLLRNDALRHRFGDAARERARVFHWDAIVDRVARLYDELRVEHRSAASHPGVLNLFHELAATEHRHTGVSA